MLSDAEMNKLAKLARLSLDEKDRQEFGSQLEKLLSYMENLQKLDLEDVEPMTGFSAGDVPLRKDEAGESLDRESAFANAPQEDQDHFAIPKVMGGN